MNLKKSIRFSCSSHFSSWAGKHQEWWQQLSFVASILAKYVSKAPYESMAMSLTRWFVFFGVDWQTCHSVSWTFMAIKNDFVQSTISQGSAIHWTTSCGQVWQNLVELLGDMFALGQPSEPCCPHWPCVSAPLRLCNNEALLPDIKWELRMVGIGCSWGNLLTNDVHQYGGMIESWTDNVLYKHVMAPYFNFRNKINLTFGDCYQTRFVPDAPEPTRFCAGCTWPSCRFVPGGMCPLMGLCRVASVHLDFVPCGSCRSSQIKWLLVCKNSPRNQCCIHKNHSEFGTAVCAKCCCH